MGVKAAARREQEASENDDEDNEPKAKQSKKTKGSVATGRGAGRPNLLNTDKWGNRQGENNWRQWNASH